MTWSQFLPVVIVLGMGAIFVWRSSSPKKHEHSDHCGCGHDHGPDPKNQKDNAVP